jgi:amino acid adenylation domain-containing protein
MPNILFEKCELQESQFSVHAPYTNYENLVLIPEQIEARAKENPNQTALELINERGIQSKILTYAELDFQANQISNAILEFTLKVGLKQNILVGICFDRSLEMIVAIFAVLKAGAGYLPIDPQTPDERLDSILADSGSQLVLGSSTTLKKFLSRKIELFDIMQILQTPKNYPLKKCKKLKGDDLAYCIYTSGSTGVPKGVLIDHSSIAIHCQVCVNLFQISPKDRVLQFAAVTFDASVEQIFSTLCAGATLIVRGKRPIDPLKVKEFLVSSQVTIAHMPTTYWNSLGQSVGSFFDGLRLRILRFGGEPMLVPPVSFEIPDHIRLINSYGPTETTVSACFFEVPSLSEQELQSSGLRHWYSIGRPFPGVEVFILDKENKLVSTGQTGEIYIGGHGVSRGYINRPELNAEKFLPHIFDQNRKIYKTGDQARWMENGCIEFLGRNDDQVKIRGYRIELGEIESALRKIEGINQAVVLAKTKSDGERHLVAFIVGECNSEIRLQLGRYLQDYMIPKDFVPIKSLPLTAHGKVDRNYLLNLCDPVNKLQSKSSDS